MLTAGVALVGLAGNLVCLVLHQCMAGHMQHPPYGLVDRGLDLVWPALLLLAAWRVTRVAYGRSRLFAWAAVVVVVFRFLGSYLDVISEWLPLLGDLVALLAWFYLLGGMLHLVWRTWRRVREGRA